MKRWAMWRTPPAAAAPSAARPARECAGPHRGGQTGGGVRDLVQERRRDGGRGHRANGRPARRRRSETAPPGARGRGWPAPSPGRRAPGPGGGRARKAAASAPTPTSLDRRLEVGSPPASPVRSRAAGDRGPGGRGLDGLPRMSRARSASSAAPPPRRPNSRLANNRYTTTATLMRKPMIFSAAGGGRARRSPAGGGSSWPGT